MSGLLIYNNNMEFNFNRDGKKEVVQLERWVWGVVYKDKTNLNQFEVKADEGFFHQVKEIDQPNVKKFILAKAGGGQSICILPPKGAKLIHKYRIINMQVAKAKTLSTKVYMFGYMVKAPWSGDLSDAKKKSIYFLNYVLPNDTVIQSDDPDLNLVKEGFIKFAKSK